MSTLAIQSIGYFNLRVTAVGPLPVGPHTLGTY